jgi:hypothetical protein
MNVSSAFSTPTRNLLALAATAAAIALLAGAGPAAGSPRASGKPSLAKVVAFHEAMDRLWTDHVSWTRNVIVDFDAKLPGLKPDLARLLANQSQIGAAIKPYYGGAAGNELARLLHTHIMEAVPVLTDAQEGNKAKLSAALAAWHVNAHQIAAFLAKANPKAWRLAAMTSMMDRHLALTTKEAVAHLEGKWQADIAAYDQVRSEILMMANSLADGIIAQFPARFAG